MGAVVEKVISGGQTGADRAALDAAMAADIPVGGRCPRGRRAEDGGIPGRYPLVETGSRRYEVRTRINVRAADGTLVLNLGELSGGTLLTVTYAQRRHRPCLLVQLDAPDRPSPEDVLCWIGDSGIRVLNVAGPRESKAPGIYPLAYAYLRRLFTRRAPFREKDG